MVFGTVSLKVLSPFFSFFKCVLFQSSLMGDGIYLGLRLYLWNGKRGLLGSYVPIREGIVT